MNTVYIVDDERIILDGLVSLTDWSKIDVKVLGASISGVNALKEILYYKPDVVITDIRMPGMDGLELIRKVKKSLPQTAFIVLSGYNEFSYAQKAIHFGVKEYLLKPVSEECVLEAVEKALLDRKRFAGEVMYPNNLDSVKSLELFQHMLNPNERDEKDVAPVVIAVCDITGYTEDIGELSSVLDKLHLREHGIYYSRNHKELILQYSNSEAEENHRLLRKIAEALEKTLHKHIYWGICDREKTGCSLYRAYLHSRQSALSAIFYGVPQLELQQISEEWRDDPFDKKNLFAAICNEESVSAINKRFESAYMEAMTIRVRPNILKRELIGLLNFLTTSFFDKYGMFAMQGKQIQNLINTIENSEDFYQTSKVMEDILQKLCNSYQDWCRDYKLKVINKIKQFIDDNMSRPLDITMIADYVHMSRNYVSSYFKKNTGMVLNEYILKVKMDQALHLLNNSTLKINQIALEVGFTDPKYFCKVFKKYTGITASDFRKGFGKNET